MPTRASAFRRAAVLVAPLMLAACNDSGVGYVEIKTISPAPALYLDTVKLEPLRNGVGVLRQKVGTTKLQVDGEGGQLAVLCNIVVQKNRITTVTVSVASRLPRCQCGRNSTTETPPSRTCVA
jgi:hypothetical protein